MISSELEGNSKGSAEAIYLTLVQRFVHEAAPYRRHRYRTGLGSQLVEMMMREDDSRGTFTRKRRPLSAA